MKKRKKLKFFPSFIFISIIFYGGISILANEGMKGKISDVKKVGVPGTEITIKNNEGKIVEQKYSNWRGAFTLRSLPKTYKMIVTLDQSPYYKKFFDLITTVIMTIFAAIAGYLTANFRIVRDRIKSQKLFIGEFYRHIIEEVEAMELFVNNVIKNRPASGDTQKRTEIQLYFLYSTDKIINLLNNIEQSFGGIFAINMPKKYAKFIKLKSDIQNIRIFAKDKDVKWAIYKTQREELSHSMYCLKEGVEQLLK
jgi:hypothetical protein